MSALIRQQGAALLSAMLTVTLVATFAASALWQQYRSLEVEKAVRGRQQIAWLMFGGLDWARLILRIDCRTVHNNPPRPPTDHLAEPWAIALEESRLSTFLAANQDNTGGMTAEESLDAFLSAQIEDAQGKLNVYNLIANGAVSQPHYLAFDKLFKLFNIPQIELSNLVLQLRTAMDTTRDNPKAPLLPQKVDQLTWLGMSAATLQKLKPYITYISQATPVNINTAKAEVIYASVPSLQLADAKAIVNARGGESFFESLLQASTRFPSLGVLNETQHSVTSQFFELRGRQRLEEIGVEELSLIKRVIQPSCLTQTQWRERTVLTSLQ